MGNKKAILEFIEKALIPFPSHQDGEGHLPVYTIGYAQTYNRALRDVEKFIKEECGPSITKQQKLQSREFLRISNKVSEAMINMHSPILSGEPLKWGYRAAINRIHLLFLGAHDRVNKKINRENGKPSQNKKE